MDLQPLELVSMDMNWNVIRKSRTSIARRPRKPGTDGFGFCLESGTKKFDAEKVVDAPLKKRKLLRESTSPPSQPSGPQTPAVHHEDSAQRCFSNSLTPGKKTKSKTSVRNSKILKPRKKQVQSMVDFSGIELLADAALSSLIDDDNADHVKDLSVLKEHAKPNANSCDKSVAPSKELRLHWDLNTVMDDWVEPCDDLVAEPNRHDSSAHRNQSFVKSDVDILAAPLLSSASRSDVIDSLSHKVKCEDLQVSTTSILREQTVVKVESNIKIEKSDQQPPATLEDPVVSDCCGSNVTQEEQGHMAEGDSDGKVEAGYDSPFEDGELREPVDCASDNVNKADSGNMENPSSERVDHGQTKEIQSSLLVKEATPNNDDADQGAQADICEKQLINEPAKSFSERKDGQEDFRSFDVCRNGAYLPQIRSYRFGDSYSNVSFLDRSGDDVIGPRGNFSTRAWDEKSNGSLDNRSNHYRNYNPYRSQYRRPSPSDRNNSYNRGPPPARRSHSRDRDHHDRYRQEYRDPRPCYVERKQHSTNFNRPKARSRSRSRSGSPIAWNFQKRKNLDTSNSGEAETITKAAHHASPDRRNRDAQSRDSRLIQRNQRFESIGYPERVRSDDHFRFTHRPTFAIRKHDEHHEKVSRAGQFDDNGGMRRFSYAHNLDSYSKDGGNEHTTTVIPESKS